MKSTSEAEIIIDSTGIDMSDVLVVSISFRPNEKSTLRLVPTESGASIIGHPLFQTTRTVFPSIDHPKVSCTWKLIYNVKEPTPENFTIISSGELNKTYSDGVNRTFEYILSKNTNSSKILFTGKSLDKIKVVDENDREQATIYFPYKKKQAAQRMVEFYQKGCVYFEWYFNSLVKSHDLVFVDMYIDIHYGEYITIINSRYLYDISELEQLLKTQDRLLFNIAYQWQPSVSDHPHLWLILGTTMYTTFMAKRYFFGLNSVSYTRCKNIEWLLDLEPTNIMCLNSGEIKSPFLTRKKYKSFLYRAVNLFFSLEARTSETGMQRLIEGMIQKAENQCPEYIAKELEIFTNISLLPHINQWIKATEIPSIRGSFFYDKKKSSLEVELRQSTKKQNKIYKGQLKIRVYEENDIYDHIVFINQKVIVASLPVHTRPKKIKKKEEDSSKNITQPTEGQKKDDSKNGAMKISEEDKQNQKMTSPVLFIVPDPDLEWTAKIEINQSKKMLYRQLLTDRKEIKSQYFALIDIQKKGAEELIDPLEKIIEDKKNYIGIRLKACVMLSKISTPQNNFIGTARLFSIFYRNFCYQAPVRVYVPKKNQYEDIPSYLLQKKIPKALLNINSTIIPQLIEQLYITILRYNNASQSRVSDCFYVASALGCLSECLKRNNGREISGLDEVLHRYKQRERISPSLNGVILDCVNICTAYKTKTPMFHPNSPYCLLASLDLSSSPESATETLKTYMKTNLLSEHTSESVASIFKSKWNLVYLSSNYTGRIGIEGLSNTVSSDIYTNIHNEDQDWFTKMELEDRNFLSLKDTLNTEQSLSEKSLKYLEIIGSLMEIPEGIPFSSPVKNISHYSKIVKTPMDFGKIRDRCKDGYYKNDSQFINDSLQVFINCRLFNKADSLLVTHCKLLEKFFRFKLSNTLRFPKIRLYSNKDRIKARPKLIIKIKKSTVNNSM
eukprot:GHVP01051901.1.p1 GENE.GHVP01051901.1~~GHVP01051901.1.p1  ORF type:complete len:1057 (-),score=175.04 GHVP01051901.1:1584-4445(-)